jgi:hypothetical protein
MTNVSRQMHQRGLLVAAVGVFLGILSQASLTDTAVSAYSSAKRPAGDLNQTCAAPADQPQSPRRVAPASSQVIEIARFDIRTASK